MPNPFISRQDLSDILGRDVTADDGALIAVDAACEIVRTIAGQTFNAVTADEIVLDGTGTDALLLPERPVTGVSAVKIDDSAVTDFVWSANGLLIRKSANFTSSVWADCLPPSIWPVGRRNITVTYDHGYAADDLPRSVRVVALQIAERLLVQGVAQAENVNGQAITYAAAATDLTAGERMILERFRAR